MAAKKKPTAKKKQETYEKIANDLAVGQEALATALTRTHPAFGTGSVIIDILSGIGGLPKGHIVEVFGPPSVGKSTLLWTCAAQVQKEGKLVVLLDFEAGGDSALQWATKLGVDVTNPDLFLKVKAEKLRTAEDGLNIIYRILESELGMKVGLIIWDSLANSSTDAIANKKDVHDSMRLASKASLLSDELPKLLQKLTVLNDNGNGVTVGFVNQVRDNMDAMAFGKKFKTPGGKAFEHNAAMRIMVTHRGFITKNSVDEFTLEKKTEKIGARLIITMAKTKHGQRERATEAKFIFQHGFDNVRSLVELAIQRKEFTKHPDFKTKFVVPPELTHDGSDVSGVEADLRTYFYTNTEAYDKLSAYMIDEINKTYWAKVEALGQPDGDDLEETDPNMVDLDGEL